MVNEVISNHPPQSFGFVSRPKEALPTSAAAADSQRQDASTTPANAVAPVTNAQATETELDVVDAVQRVQDYVQTIERDLHFSIDEDSGRTIIKVIDPATDEVVRQIPPEELLDILHSLENGSGGLVEAKA